MADPRRDSRRRSLYVRQNKAYQILLAILVVAFILISALVINTTILQPSGVWRDNVLIRMILERRAGD